MKDVLGILHHQDKAWVAPARLLPDPGDELGHRVESHRLAAPVAITVDSVQEDSVVPGVQDAVEHGAATGEDRGLPTGIPVLDAAGPRPIRVFRSYPVGRIFTPGGRPVP